MIELKEENLIAKGNQRATYFHPEDKNKLIKIDYKKSKKFNQTKEDIKWINQKVWMAMGALCVISISGGIFAGYFKTLNKQQIEEAIKPLEQKSESAQNTAELTNKTLQNIIKSYNIRVE